MKKVYFVCCIMVFFFLGRGLEYVCAQDFTDIKKRKPFRISGQLSADFNTSLSSLESLSRPFAYLFNVSIAPSIYGFDLPLQLSFGNNGLSYSHPFNMLQFTPSYKWVKAYIGRTSMMMSPYGLAGRGFDGIGFELTPLPSWSFAAMFGRLEKAEEGDSLKPGTYRRFAYGLKVGLNIKKQKVDLHFLHGWDVPTSLSEPLFNTPGAKQNFVVSLQGNFPIIEQLSLTAEGGLSYWLSPQGKEVASNLGSAFKIGLNVYGAQFLYERVSPFYQSMGAYYFNNDLEHILLGYSGQIKKKVDLMVQVGFERDDLKKEKQSRMNRIVASAQLHCAFNEQWNMQASYSNFTTQTRIKPLMLDRPDDPLVQNPDTVSFRQLSQQAQLELGFNSRKEARYKQSVSLSFSFQESKDQRETDWVDYFYVTCSYRLNLKEGYSLSSSVNFSGQWKPKKQDASGWTAHMGPSLGANKTFLEDKSLDVSLRLQYYVGWEKAHAGSGIFRWQGGVGYTLKKNHRFDLQLSVGQQHKLSQYALAEERTDFTGSIRYSYRF